MHSNDSLPFYFFTLDILEFFLALPCISWSTLMYTCLIAMPVGIIQ